MGKEWKVLEEHIYENFAIFSARRSKRVNPRTGKPFDFFLMSGLDWVNIIALTPKNEVVLVKQFRHGLDQFTLETPGGTVDATDPNPKATAIRELAEETGYVTKDAELLGVIAANPAMQSMKVHCFLAKDVVLEKSQMLDAGEDIEVVTMSFEEAKSQILQGNINHALVVAAFGLYAMRDK